MVLDLKVGRDMNISPNFGINIDLGPAFILHEKEIVKRPQSNFFDLDFDIFVLPSASIGCSIESRGS